MSYPKPGVDSPGRVVFLSFPVDTVPPAGTPPDNEAVLFKNVLKFLAPGADGIGTVLLDNAFYSLPDRVTVEVGDSDLAGSGSAQVTFSTSSATNRVIVNRVETSHDGLFRGTITLVAASPGPNQLPAVNGGTITATYFDASHGSNVVATARVDTVPPGDFPGVRGYRIQRGIDYLEHFQARPYSGAGPGGQPCLTETSIAPNWSRIMPSW